VTEAEGVDATIGRLTDMVSAGTDVDRLIEIANTAIPVHMESQVADASTTANPDVRIAVARDAAFGFYYPDDLEALEDAGAKAYAECGGLMYLAKNIQWRDEKYDMVGVVPGDIVVHDGPQGRGYVVLEETGQSLWSPASVGPPQSDATIPAHEFHYARLENLAGESGYAYRILRGHGVDGQHDGLIVGNLLAGFVHHRNTEADPWVRRFVDFVRETSKAVY
jgi:cobyrinic acid a,c-diamide synthase